MLLLHVISFCIFQTIQYYFIFVYLYLVDVVLTSKHHEGWCNFPSSYHWNWNSVDKGPKHDLVGDLTNSVRAVGLHMGLYHSLMEWYHPLSMKDNDNNCSTTLFPDEVLRPTLMEMVDKYKVITERWGQLSFQFHLHERLLIS